MEARQSTGTSTLPIPHPRPSQAWHSSEQTTSKVYTYHCLCTHLLFATTTPLPLLPRRSASSTSDAAYILPLPPPPSSPSPDHDSDSLDSPEPPSTQLSKQASPSNTDRNPHYAILLNPSLSQKPQNHRLSSGFEKRYLWRCGRCKLVVGYQLDKAQYPGMDTGTGRREDVVYVLPGGVQNTEDMGSGKEIGDKDVVLGGEGKELL